MCRDTRCHYSSVLQTAATTLITRSTPARTPSLCHIFSLVPSRSASNRCIHIVGGSSASRSNHPISKPNTMHAFLRSISLPCKRATRYIPHVHGRRDISREIMHHCFCFTHLSPPQTKRRRPFMHHPFIHNRNRTPSREWVQHLLHAL